MRAEEESSFDGNDFRSVAEASVDLSLIMDRQGRIQRIITCAEWMDLHLSDPSARPFFENLLHPDDQVQIAVLPTESKQRFQARLFKKNGSHAWMLWTICFMPYQNFYYLTANEMTGAKSESRSRTHLEAKLQQVLRDGKIGYWEVDFTTGQLTVSENIRLWWGLESNEPITHEIYNKLLHPEDAEKVMASQKAILETLQPQELIHRTRKPDGSYIWVHGTGHPMLDENGKIMGLMGTSMDITERVELENSIRHHQAKILTSSRLSAIGEMATTMAHEINNPLAIIHLQAQELKEQVHKGTLLPESVSERAEKISQTALRISRIVRSLRTLSRDGQNDPFQPISIRRILEDTLELCRQKFLKGNIQIKLDFPQSDLLVKARPTQISQVLLNLLNNAYDAIESCEEKWIELSLMGGPTSIEIRVKDSGPGVPPELHERIFDPFFTTKDPSRGTGIGLSVSRSIISSHSGILAINRDAPYTEFLIELPRINST